MKPMRACPSRPRRADREIVVHEPIYIGHFTYQRNCFIFGPVVYYLVSDAALRSFSAAEHIALKDGQFVLSEYNFFYQMLVLSAMLVTNQVIDDSYTSFDQEDFEQNLLKDLSDIDNYRLKLSEYGKVNVSRKLEGEVMRLIKSGDEEKLVQLFNRSVNLLTRVGSMAENPKKQYEYMAVIGVSLAARAAMDCGINARKAYAINDVYLQKIEKCTDVKELLHTAAKAVILYTRMVKEKRRSKPFAVGFRVKKSNGKYRYFWLYRVIFGIPATNLATKDDAITFSTPTIEGTVYRRNKLDGQGRHPWKAEVNEDDASVQTATITGWYAQVYEPSFAAEP